MKDDFGTYPIDYESYKKALHKLQQEELKQIEHDVKKAIVNAYAPESTRWHRNHTDVAQWYFIWSQNKRIVQLNTEIITAREKMCEIITKQWYEKIMKELKI